MQQRVKLRMRGTEEQARWINLDTLLDYPLRRDRCDKEHANPHFVNGVESVMEYAETLELVDVAPVVHGRWTPYCNIILGDGWRCSICGLHQFFEVGTPKRNGLEYCPRCGAKMDAE